MLTQVIEYNQCRTTGIAEEFTDGSTGTLAISGGLSLSAAATVSSSSVTLAVNDAVRGQATFRVARV